MTADLPDERDDELGDAQQDEGAEDAATTGDAAGGGESQAVEPAFAPAAENVSELSSDPFLDSLPIPELHREADLSLPREAQAPAADDPRRVVDEAVADPRARVAEAAAPSVGEQPPIEQADLPREGRDRLEVGVHGGGEMGDPVKRSESSQQPSTSFAGAAAPPTPTLPVEAGGEPLFRAPQVMLLVQLAEARSVYDDRIVVAGKQLADDYRAIAESEVKLGFWQYENQRRAADYRLRGPSW